MRYTALIYDTRDEDNNYGPRRRHKPPFAIPLAVAAIEFCNQSISAIIGKASDMAKPTYIPARRPNYPAFSDYTIDGAYFPAFLLFLPSWTMRSISAANRSVASS